jgi:hypothetical protein
VLEEPKDGKSHSGVANFSEVLLNDEEATMQQLNKLCRNEISSLTFEYLGGGCLLK